MTFTAQGKENLYYIDLTMDCSSDEEISQPTVNYIDLTGEDVDMEMDDEIEYFYDEEEDFDPIEVFNDEDEHHFFDEDVTESDMENGRCYFDNDNNFYQYNIHDHHSDSCDNERDYYKYQDSFFERDPETIDECIDDFFDEEFSVLAPTSTTSNSNNKPDLDGLTLVERE